jgi:hypothetical protein
VSKLAELAGTRASRIGRQWDPPDELVDDLIAARAAGHGYHKIADALRADGHEVGKQGVQGWFERLEQAANDCAD